MRLLFVTASLGLGGSERCMAEMIRRIDLEKYTVTVLSLLQCENMHSFDNRINIINGLSSINEMLIPTSQFMRNIKNWKNPKKIFSKIKCSIQVRFSKMHLAQFVWENIKNYISNFEEEFDIAIGYGQGMATFFTIDKITNIKRKILWVNTDLEKAHYNIDYLRPFYNKADIVVADSQNGKTLLSNLFPEIKSNIYAVPNLLDTETIKELSTVYVPEIDKNLISLLTVARLAEAKAIHLAVEAAAILKNLGYKFKWYVLGDGNEKPKITELIDKLQVADCFILLGSNKNPYPWFANCDIYVQTSIYEGSCMTINEAMIFCKPIVSTNFKAVYEKVNDKNGYITEMSGQSIAKSIKKLFDNNSIMQSMSKAQRENPIDYNDSMNIFYSLLKI